MVKYLLVQSSHKHVASNQVMEFTVFLKEIANQLRNWTENGQQQVYFSQFKEWKYLICRSISFVLVTSSLAFILLCVSYYIIDMKKWWTGKPFLFAGMNSTIMYIGHNMTYSNFLIHWYIDEASANKTHFMSLLDDVWATGIWVFVAYYLYKIKFFFSI